MTTDTKSFRKTDTEHASTDSEAPEELLIDTSKMGEGKRQAMEVAEAARQKNWQHESFARKLFMGQLDMSFMAPFPAQKGEDKDIGDELCQKVTAVLKEHIDPDDVDETRTIPESGIQALKDVGVFAMKVPKRYGGLGLSQVNYNRVMQLISSYCASTAVLVSAHQSIGVPQPLKMFGTHDQKKNIYR